MVSNDEQLEVAVQLRHSAWMVYEAIKDGEHAMIAFDLHQRLKDFDSTFFPDGVILAGQQG